MRLFFVIGVVMRIFFPFILSFGLAALSSSCWALVQHAITVHLTIAPPSHLTITIRNHEQRATFNRDDGKFEDLDFPFTVSSDLSLETGYTLTLDDSQHQCDDGKDYTVSVQLDGTDMSKSDIATINSWGSGRTNSHVFRLLFPSDTSYLGRICSGSVTFSVAPTY